MFTNVMGGKLISKEEKFELVEALVNIESNYVLGEPVPRGMIANAVKHLNSDYKRAYTAFKSLSNEFSGKDVDTVHDQLLAEKTNYDSSSSLDTLLVLSEQANGFEIKAREYMDKASQLDQQVNGYLAKVRNEVIETLQAQNKYLKTAIDMASDKFTKPANELSLDDLDELRRFKSVSSPTLNMFVQAPPGDTNIGFSLLMPFTKVETVQSNGSKANEFYQGLVTAIHEVVDCADCTKAYFPQGFLDLHVMKNTDYHSKAQELSDMLNSTQFLPKGVDPLNVNLQGSPRYRLLDD